MLSEIAKKIQGSPTLAITAKAKQLKADGKDVVNFGAGEPDFDTPGFIKDAAMEAIQNGITKYTPASGTLELKKAIVNKLKTENNLDYSADQIIVNCGAKHSLYNLFMCLVQEKDEVIIPSPYWVSYPEMVKAAGAVPVIADCLNSDNFKLTPDILQKYITPNSKILVLNSPSNPSGILYTKEELKEIGNIVNDNDLLVISDEIYEHLIYDGSFVSIAQISDELKQRTIIVNGVSKAYSMTGWRIGYTAGDSQIISACGRLQSHSTSNPTSFAQTGAVMALNSKESPEIISKMVTEFKKRRDYVFNELSSISKIDVVKPEGAFYIFPNIAEFLGENIRTSHDFAMALLDKKLVALVPGEGFGAPGYIRISYAVSLDDISKGIGRLKEFLDEL